MRRQSERSARAVLKRWGPLAAVVGLGAYLRFAMLSRIGIRGDDTLYYLSMARGWVELPEGYRLAVMLPYRWIHSLSGYSDWAIKGFNATLDTASIALVFVIAKALARHQAQAVVAALLYALAPRPILFARTELIHPSSTFLLLSCVALLAGHESIAKPVYRHLRIALAGVACALCCSSHEELGLMIPGLVFWLLAGSLQGTWRADRRAVLVRMSSRAGSFLGPFALVSLALGYWKNVFAFLMPSAAGDRPVAAMGHASSPFVRWFENFSLDELWTVSVTFNTSWPLSLAFAIALLSLAVAFFAKLSGRTETNETLEKLTRGLAASHFALALVVLSCMLGNPLFKKILPRIMLPCVPLMIVTVTVCLDRWATLASPKRSAWVVSVVGLVLASTGWTSAYGNLAMRSVVKGYKRKFSVYTPRTLPEDFRTKPWQVFDFSKYPISGYRFIHDALKDEVGPDQRLLVTPYVISSDGGERRGFRHYFGDDAVYIEDCQTDVEQFVISNKIAYITITGFHNKRLKVDPTCVGLTRRTYTPTRERNEMFKRLDASGRFEAALILSRSDLVVLKLRLEDSPESGTSESIQPRELFEGSPAHSRYR